MSENKTNGYAFGVSGGVAAGPCPAMNKLRQLVLAKHDSAPILISDAFSRMYGGQKLRTIELPERHWEVMDHEGGSWLGNSKPGMPETDEDFRNIYNALVARGIRKLVWVGGDDSAKTLARVAAQGNGFQTILIPKTVDWDVNLPGRSFTLGTQSCAHYGAENVRALQVNSRMLDRTYAMICMGRHSGRLPWLVFKKANELPGIGKVEVLLTKEFFRFNTTCATVAAIIVGSRLKFEQTHPDQLPFAHTVILGENLADILQPGELNEGRREAGNVVLAELGMDRAFGDHISRLLQAIGRPNYTKIEQMGVGPRGGKPIAEDISLAHALAEHAFNLLEEGRSHEVVYQFPRGSFGSVPFDTMVDPTGGSISLGLDREMIDEVLPQMVLLTPADLQSPNVEGLAKRAGLSVETFRHMFGPAVEALYPEI